MRKFGAGAPANLAREVGNEIPAHEIGGKIKIVFIPRKCEFRAGVHGGKLRFVSGKLTILTHTF